MDVFRAVSLSHSCHCFDPSAYTDNSCLTWIPYRKSSSPPWHSLASTIYFCYINLRLSHYISDVNIVVRSIFVIILLQTTNVDNSSRLRLLRLVFDTASQNVDNTEECPIEVENTLSRNVIFSLCSLFRCLFFFLPSPNRLEPLCQHQWRKRHVTGVLFSFGESPPTRLHSSYFF